MPDNRENADRRRIIERADRMLRQSRILRKLADELDQESSDIRESAKRVPPRAGAKKR